MAEVYPGDLDDYSQWIQNKVKQEESLNTLQQGDDVNKTCESKLTSPTSKKEKRRADAEKRKALQPLNREIKKLENTMEQLQARNEEVEQQLTDSSIYDNENIDKLKNLLKEKKTITLDLDDIEQKWLELSEEYETAMM